jgi:hypothetical protein
VALSYLNNNQSIDDINIVLANQRSPNFFDEAALAEVQLMRILLKFTMTGTLTFKYSLIISS